MKKKYHKRKKSSLIQKSANFNPFFAFLFAAAIATVGVWLLKNSFAQTTSTGTITVYSYSRVEGFPLHPALSGVSVTIQSLSTSGGCLTSTTTKTTAGPGAAKTVFTCKAPLSKSTRGYIYSLASFSKAGYVIDDVLPKPATSFEISNGKTLSTTIYMQRDTDGDGVGDITDQCDSTTGPSSNKGCPKPKPAHPPSPKPNPSPSPIAPPASTSSANPSPPPPPAPAIIKAKKGDRTPPSIPTEFTAETIDDSIYLSWTASEDNIKVLGYTIERSVDQENWKVLAENITDTFYTDTSLDPSQTYYYLLRAEDSAGNQSEGVYASAENNQPTEDDQPATQEQKSRNLLPIIFSIAVIVFAIAGWIGWLIMRRRNTYIPPMDAVDVEDGPVMPDTVTTVHPGGEHTSKSLKDMVMEDYQQPKDKK